MSLDLLRYHPQPRILLASQEAWQSQELKAALEASGLSVTVVHGERETLDEAHSLRPHGILLDAGLSPPGYGLCRTLRTIVFAAPIVLLRPGQPSREDHLDALRAGAWDLRGAPLDTEDLILRLATYLEPKLELDRVSVECLVDRVSGLYNHLGLARRADELAALVTRHGLALACVVVRPARKRANRSVSDRLAATFKSVGRASDAVGRTGPAEFAVFAPATNAWAAGRLVRRLTDSAEHGQTGVRTGFSAMAAAHKISPHTLLARARAALEGH